MKKTGNNMGILEKTGIIGDGKKRENDGKDREQYGNTRGD